tara:strand:+ start:233455 stop:234711 length:1257 start_codon:yes stop_codon:yes gene_type:complete
MGKRLFREEALAHKGERLWGDLLHIKPINYSCYSAFIVFITLGAIIFLITNTYYRKQEVRGQLVPDKGMTLVGPANSGRIISINTELNKQVRAGELIFTIQRDETVSKDLPYSDEVLSNLLDRKAYIHQQIQLKEQQLERKQEENLHQLENLQSGIEQIKQLVSIESKLLDIKYGAYTTIESLVKRELLASVDSERSQTDYLQQQSALKNILLRKSEMEVQKDELSLGFENYITETRLAVLALRSELAILDQEILTFQSRKVNKVFAPIAGTVSSINVNIGDFVSVQQAVVTITPLHTELEARLYVPSRAIGFLKTGQKANIRLDAYPYQKFGTQSGRVKSISNSILLSEEIPRNLNIQEPVYQVIIKLDSQSISGFGEEIHLRAGILLNANIILEQRSLFEWLLAPMFSILKKDKDE